MRNYSVTILKDILILFFSILISGCSFHYNRGEELEAEGRWEEAAIEYRLASIEDPENQDIVDSLNRTYKRVSIENFEAYKKYLEKREFKKAYKRLDATLNQNPEFKEAILEKNKWKQLLISGKVEFEFNQLFSNLRLADEMILQIKINTPQNKLLTGNISGETGIFFIEEALYDFDLSQLAEFTINCIGLKIKRKSHSGILNEEFKKFVNFRELTPIEVKGRIKIKTLKSQKNILDHRPSLISNKKEIEAWFPPDLFRYKIHLFNNSAKIISELKRSDFAPSIIYINTSDNRVNIDFGVNKITMDDSTRKWSIFRKKYRTKNDDYYYKLGGNIALYSYFFYDNILKFFQ